MDRRSFLKSFISSAALLAVPVTAFNLVLKNESKSSKLIEHHFFAMGSHGKIQLSSNDLQQANIAIDAAVNQINYLETKLSKFSKYSDVYRLNHQTLKPIFISNDTSELLRIGLKIQTITENHFDMGMGNYLSVPMLDHNVEPIGNLTLTTAQVKEIPLVHLDGNTAKVNRENTMLDLGGIGKGYALDKAMAQIKAVGIKHAAIELGGDIIVYGGKNQSTPWTIGIDSKAPTTKQLPLFKLKTAAIASSGNYIKPGHIINPTTLKSVDDYAIVTVIGPDATTCDALATAANTMSVQQLQKLSFKFQDYKFHPFKHV